MFAWYPIGLQSFSRLMLSNPWRIYSDSRHIVIPAHSDTGSLKSPSASGDSAHTDSGHHPSVHMEVRLTMLTGGP